MISIVFQNQHFVICDKPGGVLTTPSRHAENDGRSCLGTALQTSLGQQIYPVHRLDFEVSGLVLFAKTAEAHREANAWFEKKLVRKTYHAWTSSQSFAHIPPQVPGPREGFTVTPGQSFAWESRQLRGKRRAYLSPEGKACRTEARFLKINEEQFLEWDLSPVTGRPHQLRLDMSRHGFPIVGDALYGSTVEWKPHTLALRAYKIDFVSIPVAQRAGLPELLEVTALSSAKCHV